MFIRRTRTRTTGDGKAYFSYRLVRSRRDGTRVRQQTLLNLGSDFAVDRRYWRMLCERISQLLSRQATLLPLACPEAVEHEAQRIAAQLVGPLRGCGGPSRWRDAQRGRGLPGDGAAALGGRRTCRAVGDGAARTWRTPAEPGLQRSAARARPWPRSSAAWRRRDRERATWRWLCRRSALGELLDTDFETMSMMRLYRASDALMSHRRAIEDHLFARVSDLFGLEHTVTLIDLTNTFLEGAARSLEGEALGLPAADPGPGCSTAAASCARCEVFAGNVDEDTTLDAMLSALEAPQQALVVMDAGVATADNVVWLR